jgi:DNA uptake protein ComE-like DNA-binding protein
MGQERKQFFSAMQHRALVVLGATFIVIGILELSTRIPLFKSDKQNSIVNNSCAPIEINLADSSDFEALPAIGPVLARRIIRYRQKIGQFKSMQQFRKVWGIDSIFDKIAACLYIDSALVAASSELPDDDNAHNNVAAKTKTAVPVFYPPAVPQDINKVTADELIATGIAPEKLCRRLIRYRDKAGGFRKMTDLNRLYGIDNEILERFERYYFVASDLVTTEKPAALLKMPGEMPSITTDINISSSKNSKSVREIATVDLNLADSAALEALPGLGPVLSGRIIAMRSALGGCFHQLDELIMIKGMRAEWLDKAIPYLKISTNCNTKKLNINQLDEHQLAAHPYIGFTTARRIVQYRKQHGYLKDKQALAKIYGIDSLKMALLTPYIRFD